MSHGIISRESFDDAPPRLRSGGTAGGKGTKCMKTTRPPETYTVDFI